nr:hypothetical protein [Tanacetum cinerariifolium]
FDSQPSRANNTDEPSRAFNTTPTQRDIGETSNEPNQATRNEFEELYANANEELYPGCDYVTRLDFMAKFTYFKVKGKLTDSIFNEMLEFIQNVFPISKGYKLPPSYYAIKKTFKTIGLGYKSIHACEHDCCLFRGKENKDLDFCLVRNTSGWKDGNTSGKKVPKKVLRYFLIIPRLQRLYKSSHTAKEMIWHATGKCTEPDKMQHPVDGRAWKKFDTMYLDFVKEPRNVRIGLVADGFNPFGNLSQAYSMWPVILTTYNLPPWLCMKKSSFMLTLLIPGPKSLGKDIDVYFRPLIEDIKVLWDRKGVETINVASCQKFNMRAMVLWTIKDFPARSSLFGDPPKEFGRDEILAQLDRLPTRVKGKHPSYGSVKIKRNVHVEHNRTKRSIFYELQYWYFLTLRHNLDIMNIKKNMLEAILNTLLMNDKSKDTAKARQNLQRLGIRKNRKKFRLFIKGVKLPDGFGSCFKHKVTDNDTNITGLKSHDYHIMMQCLLPYGLQQYLPDKIAKPIIELCFLFKQICSATLMEDDILKAQIKVVDILCDLELIYPPDLFDIMIHLVIHLPLEALEGGPIRLRWMFPFERYMKKLKELKKVKWYVLHNSPEIDTYRSQFKSLFPNKDMKEEFPDWFGSQIRQRHVDNDKDPEVSTTNDQSTEVDAPPDIIDVPDEDDDIIDDEDALPHDLADSDDEELINVDDDGVDKMLHGPKTVAVRIVSLHTMYPPVVGVASLTEAKGKRKPNLGGRAAGRLHTRDKTRNLSLKEITDKKGPIPIGFEVRDKETFMPLGDHAAHWSSYIEEVIRGVPLYYPSWLKVPKERKAALITYIGTQFDLRPHMESPDWTEIDVGIQQHLQKAYNTNKVAFKAQHWVIDPETGTYNVEMIRRTPHTVNEVFTRDEDRLIYEEMGRLEATSTYIDDEINHLARRDKQRGHIPGVGKVLPARVTAGPSRPVPESMLKSLHKKVDFTMRLFKRDSKYSDAFSQFESAGVSGSGRSGGCGDDEESADDQEDEDGDGDGGS